MAPRLITVQGIAIHVFPGDHLPPHFHAFYGDDRVVVNARTGEVMQGGLPNNKMRVLNNWLKKDNNLGLIEEQFFRTNPDLK